MNYKITSLYTSNSFPSPTSPVKFSNMKYNTLMFKVQIEIIIFTIEKEFLKFPFLDLLVLHEKWLKVRQVSKLNYGKRRIEIEIWHHTSNV